MARPLGRGTEGPRKWTYLMWLLPPPDRAGVGLDRLAATPPMRSVITAAASRARSTSSGTRLGRIRLPEALTSSAATTEVR
jgi:hypothetical protein